MLATKAAMRTEAGAAKALALESGLQELFAGIERILADGGDQAIRPDCPCARCQLRSLRDQVRARSDQVDLVYWRAALLSGGGNSREGVGR